MRAGVICFLLDSSRKLFQELQGISPSSNLGRQAKSVPDTYQRFLRITADLDDVRPLAYKGLGQ